MNKDFAIGIDLGTTNSAISVWKDGKVEIIPNALNELLTPSVISIDENDVVLTGQAAKSRLITKPHETVAVFKRFMGTDKSFKLHGKEYNAAELSALVLKSLKQDAETYLGQPITDVVISCPAYFNDQQRKHVRHAAELAGLNAVRLINEPTAACLAYSVTCLQHKTETDLQIENGKFLVFDLGGGTFDITVVEFFDNFIEVHASTGNNRLGGEDFTQDLVDEVLARLETDRSQVNLETLSIVISACEKAKCKHTPSLSIDIGAPFNKTIEFSQEHLTTLWRNTLDKLSSPLKQALRDAKLSPNEVDNLIFVGGATRLPQVQQLAARLLGRFGSNSLDPDLVVCMGAAIQAGCRLRDIDLQEIILTDVCPYSLGIETIRDNQRGVFSPIIERNTIIPASRVERYWATHLNQKQILIKIYQGERLWAKDNLFIEELTVDIPENETEPESIDVRFSYDINGLLEVDVTIISTGKTIQKVIDKTPKGLSDEDKAKSIARLTGLKTHPRDSLPNITLMEQLNSAYEQSLKESRDQIESLIFRFSDLLETQDSLLIQKERTYIEKTLQSILSI